MLPSSSFFQIPAQHNNMVSTQLHLHHCPERNNLLLGRSKTCREPRVTLTNWVQSHRG